MTSKKLAKQKDTYMEQTQEFAHLRVPKPVHRQAAVLAAALNTPIYSLIEDLLFVEWQNQLKAGLVTEAMIRPAKVSAKGKKKAAQ